VRYDPFFKSLGFKGLMNIKYCQILVVNLPVIFNSVVR